MANNHDDGGPAFPPSINIDGVPGSYVYATQVTGMSLRDYFAAKSIPELIRQWYDPDDVFDYPAVAADAYKIADAMLAERSRTDADNQKT